MSKKYNIAQINDLECQKILWDRRAVYEVLKKHNIPIAEHYYVNRKDTPEITQELLESMGKSQKKRGKLLIEEAKEWR